MPTFDLAKLINFLTDNFIGFIFGLGLGYVTYLFNRKRDDLQWAREKLTMEENHKHEKEQIEITWKQKLQELHIQYLREDQQQIRDMLTKGSDRPAQEIQAILAGYETLRQASAFVLHSLRVDRLREDALLVVRDYLVKTLPDVLEMYEKGASVDEIRALIGAPPSIKTLDSTSEKPAGLLPAKLSEDDKQLPPEKS